MTHERHVLQGLARFREWVDVRLAHAGERGRVLRATETAEEAADALARLSASPCPTWSALRIVRRRTVEEVTHHATHLREDRP